MSRKQLAWLIGLSTFALAALIAVIVLTVPTRDDGLRWFNEEFWITLVINFISVAVSIGLTVYISLYILRRQIAHDANQAALDRFDRSLELTEMTERERRVRWSTGLEKSLENYGTAIGKFAFTARRGSVGDERLARMGTELVGHDVRHAGDGEFHGEIVDLITQVTRWLDWYLLCRSEQPQSPWGPWLDAGQDLAHHALMLGRSVPDWQVSGGFFGSEEFERAVDLIDQASTAMDTEPS